MTMLLPLCLGPLLQLSFAFVVPGWDYVVQQTGNAHCVNASAVGGPSNPYSENNTRWTWLALPNETTATPKPEGGWPVYMAFTPWIRDVNPDQSNQTCGDGWNPEGHPLAECMVLYPNICCFFFVFFCPHCAWGLGRHVYADRATINALNGTKPTTPAPLRC